MQNIMRHLKLAIVLSVMPLMGFSCWRSDNYLVRPDLVVRDAAGIKSDEWKKYDDALLVFKNWAMSEQLISVECGTRPSIGSYPEPCEAYLAEYETCGLFACSKKTLRITLMIDPKYQKIRIEFFDLGRLSKSKREIELQESLKSAIEKVLGEGAMVEFKEPNNSLQPTAKAAAE